jgi:hypothetical protein
MKHSNKTYGSMATPCNRCDLEFAFQIPQQNIDWKGLPCKATPYTRQELFNISKKYMTAVINFESETRK